MYLPGVSAPPDRRGQRFDNPVTGESALVLTDPGTHPEGVLDAIEFTKPPPLLQAAILGPLAALGRARGLRPNYEEYLETDVVVEPDPQALAALDANGRLAPAPAA